MFFLWVLFFLGVGLEYQDLGWMNLRYLGGVESPYQFISRVIGPLSMAENKWATGVKETLGAHNSTYNW